MIVPSTAMPRAAPSSRVVSLTAEPTPALSIGTADMMVPVAGAKTRPMPRPWRANAEPSSRYELSTVSRVSRPKAMDVRTKPPEITAPTPNRSARPTLRGAVTIMAAAQGRVARPVASVE